MKNVKLNDWEIRTLITIIDHVRSQATGGGQSAYGIDTLCRKDCTERWLELRKRLVFYVGDPVLKEKT